MSGSERTIKVHAASIDKLVEICGDFGNWVRHADAGGEFCDVWLLDGEGGEGTDDYVPDNNWEQLGARARAAEEQWIMVSSRMLRGLLNLMVNQVDAMEKLAQINEEAEE